MKTLAKIALAPLLGIQSTVDVTASIKSSGRSQSQFHVAEADGVASCIQMQFIQTSIIRKDNSW